MNHEVFAAEVETQTWPKIEDHPSLPTALDATLTPPTAQHPATSSYRETENPLIYAGSATSSNTQKPSLPPLQGGGRWFKSSIAH
jgi:hypothetical protein